MSANTNRTKGHNFERELAIVFRALGFSYCKTSRQASRLYDDSGIDLWGIPYLVQAKKVKASINYGKLIKEIEGRVEKNFPPGSPEREHPIVIFHRKEKDKLVIMKENDFINLLKKIHGHSE